MSNLVIDKETKIELYATMVRIRTFENRARILIRDGEIPARSGFYTGQEAVAAGVCAHLSPSDQIGSTHRALGHLIAKGCDLKRLMAELCGKSSGLNKGKAGPYHIFDPSVGALGANGIVGGSVPMVAGYALAHQLRDDGGVAVSFYGEGAFLETIALQPVAEGGSEREASTPIIPVDTIDGDKDAVGLEKPPRKRWPWVVAGLLISVGCLIAFLGTLSGENEAPELDRPTPPVEMIEDDLPGEAELLSPDALFRRAESLVENGREILAAQEFLKAGNLFLEEEDYLRAVDSYLRAVEVHAPTVERSRLVEGQFTQAIFLGSADEHVWPLIEKIEQFNADWPVLAIARARQSLFVGAFDEAREIIDAVLEEEPGNPLALAVLVEYHIMLDEFDAADRIIAKVFERSDELPKWLAEHFHGLAIMLPE